MKNLLNPREQPKTAQEVAALKNNEQVVKEAVADYKKKKKPVKKSTKK